ncbi:fluoride efflux transporter CrcB [Psychrobacillus sp. NPDC058041]|uniref:fluoride efflux transporter CrcB n=1 Tax=Psychrobacillus sp. NPDC058041 TaxID=3346310 RepID=UPI0036DE5901
MQLAYLFVGLAGALGAITRYSIGLMLYTHSIFPFATLIVNLVGCYLLPFLTSSVFRKSKFSPNVQTAITTGFLGSFTTFSAFSVETVKLLQQGEIVFAVLYILISVVGGIVMSNLGWKHEVTR